MEWPLKRPPVPVAETPTWSLYYLAVCPTPSDPTMVWGTDVPTAGLDAYLKRANADSDVLILPAHVLVWAVGRCLREHPEFNRRVLKRRLYEFKQVNVLFPIIRKRLGPEVCLLCDVDCKPLAEIARDVWRHWRAISNDASPYQSEDRLFRRFPNWMRPAVLRSILWGVNRLYQPVALWGHRTSRSGTMINYLGQPGLPPMRTFKPSRFPNDAATLNVTLGPAEPRGADGPVASLFVRADHRVVDAYQLGQFVGSLRRYLADPALLESPPDAAAE